jgi:hypothetical protein
VYTIHVGVDLALVGLDRRRQRNAGGVGAATAEGGDVAGFVDALEARHDHHRAGVEIAADVVAVDVEDAGLGEGVVGEDAHLAAGVAAGLDAELLEGHAQQTDGDLFAGGDHHVELAGAGIGADFLGQGDQAVGLAAHRGQDDHHLVPLGVELRDPLGHVLDPFGVADGSAAIFLNYERHLDF